MKIQFGRRFWIVATAVIVVFTVFVVGRNALHAVKIKRQINPKLKIEGILLTMTDSRTNYGKQIDTLIRQAYGSKIKVFDQTIPRSVRAAETSAAGKSIFQYDPKSKVAEAYQSLAKEVLVDAEKRLKRSTERSR